jgi:hypothetical protein
LLLHYSNLLNFPDNEKRAHNHVFIE